ncbi:MAG: DUF2949 domain-containing protein [Cyanobacteria bacterium J06639_18]
MLSARKSEFISFLEKHFGISIAAIDLALRDIEDCPSLLPMTLWQYGLVNISQLDEIFDWLESQTCF